MATYIPNATQTTEPVESRTVESAALEFRTLKTSITARIEDVQDGLDTEIVNRIAGDANLQTQNNAQDVRLTAIENALPFIGEGVVPGTVYVQRFSGTGVQTAFTLDVVPQAGNVVDIYVNGLYQNKDTFSVAGAVITFSAAPPAGTDNIEVQVTVTIALGETDASLVNFQQAGTGAVVRTAQDKMRESRSISDYSSLQVAAESVQTGHSIYTGGKVMLPTGAISVSAELNIPTPSANNILGLTLNGNGKQATTLNFSGAGGGSNGIEFNHPIFFGMADVCIREAPLNGIKVTGYNTNPALPSWSHMNLDRVRSSFNGSAGLDFDRGFMGKLNQVFATHNANAGFLFRGLHTSIHLDNCYAASNATSGFSLTYMTYSSLTACAADTNLIGYAIANSSSTSLRNCGAESNQRSAVLATASAAVGRNYPITIDGLLAFNNNTSNAGYPNAIHVLSTDSTPNYVVARACRSHDPANATVDALVNGVGAYLVDEDNSFPNGVSSTNGGYIHHVNRTKYVHGLSVTAATAVCELMNHQGHQGSYGGEVVIHASNTSPNSTAAKNTATYKLLVDKGAGGNTVVEIAKAGQTTGAAASAPSFTWSLVGDSLTATPVGSTGSTFYFEILCQGPIKVK